jgi:hypothetical protein
VLRRIFGPKRDKLTGGWRKLRSEELRNLYCSLRVCSTNGAKRNAYRLLVGKPEGKNHSEDQDVGGWIIIKCS